jgi:DNA polymerase
LEPNAASLIPPGPTLTTLRAAAAGCRACPLWERATQTVFGEGGAPARALLVGEQPGDREDRAGRPFVGPAGLLLDRALAAAGIDRATVYVTNAVKHFKWEPRGKRRIHQRPTERELAACRPWLDAEIELVKPQMVVCLGATAIRTLLGRALRVRDLRGRFFSGPGIPLVTATVHPSAPLRAPDDRRQEEIDHFLDDWRLIGEALRRLERGEDPRSAPSVDHASDR